ncbi:hypothetical protein A2311_05790 [candidate division WOR-1 bacterium RIFOXYB2_FULL_48_7]|uniref:Uncharacterized protein n=1 Tax=candidate division WOR-1 bacterium RIFOXYB2_FULL_48_7 TaxID=1802583 RepID=A0A1F4TVY7_UNCSA|nr:MAG: hypothetical protein A2311_05790 [candidate division WOR-1 bacterium RIFOXYB2_FULL_48_7]
MLNLVQPATLNCRLDRLSPFLQAAKAPSPPQATVAGFHRLLTLTSGQSIPAFTAYRCTEMEMYLGLAARQGDLKLGYFPLIVQAYPKRASSLTCPPELQSLWLEIDSVRLVYEIDTSWIHNYGSDAGIIMQPLTIAGVDVTGWMVAINKDKQQAFLSRPTWQNIRLGLSPADTDEAITRKLMGLNLHETRVFPRTSR